MLTLVFLTIVCVRHFVDGAEVLEDARNAVDLQDGGVRRVTRAGFPATQIRALCFDS